MISAAVAAMVAVLALVAHRVVRTGFGAAEETQVRVNLDRARNTLQHEADTLALKLKDWAFWDDTHAFAQDRNLDYLDSNLGYTSMETLGVAFMIILDAHGELVFGQTTDTSTQTLKPLPETIARMVRDRHPIFLHDNEQSVHNGPLITPEGVFLVASRPILTSEQVGPIAGTIAFGKRLDTAAINALASRLSMDIRLIDAHHPAPIDQPLADALRAAADQPAINPVNDRYIAGAALLRDINGNPGLILRIEIERYVMAQARETLALFLGGLIVVAVLMVALTCVLLERSIIARLVRLDADVGTAREDQSLASRVAVRGTDEIGRLARTINQFLADVASARERLVESEEQFRLLSDLAPCAIIMTDARGHATYFNAHWLELTGSNADAQLGEGWLDHIHPEDRENFRLNFTAEGNSPAVRHAEFRVRDAAGHWRWAMQHAVPRIGPAGEIVGFIAASVDITERRVSESRLRRFADDLLEAKLLQEEQSEQLEARSVQLERALDAANAAARVKGEFLANMSHEIRTPMTAILGFAEMMTDPALPHDERDRCTDAIIRNGHHLLAIINDILDQSKIDAGKMSIELLPVDPRAIVHEAADMLAHRARAKGLSFAIEIDPDAPESMIADPVRLRQILINLVSNAVKFTERGGVTIRVSRAGEPDRPTLRVDVADTGIGIAPEHLGKLFSAFAQADGSMTRRFGGTGLGLAISRRLAELMQGSLSVRSVAGVGSTFSLDLPARAPEAAPAPQQAAARPAPETARALDGARILLAEDGPDNQVLLGTLLRRAGAFVLITDAGDRAAHAALHPPDNTPFDLILMDMQMPGMDGYQATSLLRARGYTSPIIALTAHGGSEERAKCLAAGCSEYLAKPITRAALIEGCRPWLNRPPRANAA